MPFGTLYTLFARWIWLGLWRRLLDRLRRIWRLACGDTAEPSAVAIDSRTCPLAPSCFARGIDGGKKICGVKVSIAVEKYGIPLALGITVQPIARGRDGVFIPTEIAWVVERSFGWLSRYRRLITLVERTKEHLVAFVDIAFISILSRRLKRLAPQVVCA